MNEPSTWFAVAAAFCRRVWEKIEFIAIETIGVVAAFGAAWVMHCALKWSLGLDYKLFDRVPVLYVIDVVDSLVFLLFIWQLLKRFRKP